MSWLFVVVLSLVLLSSIGALRVNTQDNFIAEGTITEEMPDTTTINGETVYNISNAGNLKYLSNHSELWDQNFQQTDNIIYTESTWNPIGNATTPFTGSYSGHYWTITFTQEINVVDVEYFGLFGRAEFGYAPVFTDVGQGCWGVGVNWQGGLNVNNSNISGYSYVGGLVGVYSEDEINISCCYTEGNIKVSKVDAVGGLVGMLERGTISNCYNKSNITGANSGGITGAGFSSGLVQNCYSVGTIICQMFGETSSGITGTYMDVPTIENCFYDVNSVKYDKK